MGNGQAIPTDTRAGILQQTTDTRTVMDEILKYSIKELNIKDFVLMSNPNQCKKYVMFFSNDLYKKFYQMHLLPTRDKKGTIVFQKIDELVAPQSEKEVKDTQSLCFIISFFYVRIFQIYGALALTVMDDLTFMADKGLLQVYAQTHKNDELGPFGRKMNNSQFRQTGGNEPNLESFTFLKPIIKSYDNKRYEIKYVDSDIHIFFYKDIENKGVFIFINKKQESRINIIISSIEGTEDKQLEWKNLSYYKNNASLPTIVNVNDLQVLTPIRIVKKNDTYEVKRTQTETMSIDKYFITSFTYILNYIKTNTESINYKSMYKSTESTTSSSEIDENLKLDSLIRNLQVEKPLPLCIARALQLLTSDPIGDKATSGVCNKAFFDKGERGSRRGITRRDDSIDESPGISALSLLFYDYINMLTPKLLLGKERTLQHYREFIQTMFIAYDEQKPREVIEKYKDLSALHDIKNRRDKKLCKYKDGREIDNEVRFNASEYDSVHSTVKKLFQIQYEHSLECKKWLSHLFEFKQNKFTNKWSIGIHQNILNNGFPALQELTEIVRDILIKYYTNCELNYKVGMINVLKATPESQIHDDKKVNVEAEEKEKAKANQARKNALHIATGLQAPVKNIQARPVPLQAKAQSPAVADALRAIQAASPQAEVAKAAQAAKAVAPQAVAPQAVVAKAAVAKQAKAAQALQAIQAKR